MNGTFFGIEMGKRSLLVHSQRMATVGHNIANLSTEGYSRQRVEVMAFEPMYRPQLNRAERPGQVGQGVETAQVRRIRDTLLDQRIIANQGGKSYWEARDKYLLMLDQLYNEPTEQSVRFLMDKFWDSWQELSLYPEQMAARHAVVQRGQSLSESIRLRSEGLVQIREMLEDDIRITVGEINEYLTDIALLNKEIVQVEAEGDQPNDLLDRRDLLVDKLSAHLSITVDDRDPDEFSVYSGGVRIVQGSIARPLSLVGDGENEGYSSVVWSETQEDFQLFGGKLLALIELRDGDLRSELEGLDITALTLMNLVNEIHSQGGGLNNRSGIDFFVEYQSVLNVQGNYDSTGDGAFDQSRIFRVTGSNVLDAEQQVGIAGIITLASASGPVTVEYRSTDTVKDIIHRINNSGADVIARLNEKDNLELRATPTQLAGAPNFVIRTIGDNGLFLTGYAGLLADSAQPYQWDQASAVLALTEDAQYAVAPLHHPSGWLSVNPIIENDVASVAAGFLQNNNRITVGDGQAALHIAHLRNQETVITGSARTFDDYFADTVANIGLKGEQAQISFYTREALMKDMEDTRQSVSGVNLDEELSNMLKYQHGYQAVARFMTAYDDLLELLIMRMGA